MVTIDQCQSAASDEIDHSKGSALVPITPAVERRSATCRMARPNLSFVAQLIATAEQLPQTRGLRRATPSDAMSAYTAHQQPVQRIGRQTRQSI